MPVCAPALVMSSKCILGVLLQLLCDIIYLPRYTRILYVHTQRDLTHSENTFPVLTSSRFAPTRQIHEILIIFTSSFRRVGGGGGYGDGERGAKG